MPNLDEKPFTSGVGMENVSELVLLVLPKSKSRHSSVANDARLFQGTRKASTNMAIGARQPEACSIFQSICVPAQSSRVTSWTFRHALPCTRRAYHQRADQQDNGGLRTFYGTWKLGGVVWCVWLPQM
ncbi:predicted protein [Plenodomus lingam JN3]|uniref:Predicted protein n=1 Tax=Leptosphaeria maculans (strain JN3 / isolate v23.1.3 / race Av1-4-5-6-7-8) TaxID=985895 RepID=E5ABS4_LEPMJ|nr:predicted protein [Plenodomus lingam JN3]CBY01115.1 predicted protein [Plenodomus lingam JN3]